MKNAWNQILIKLKSFSVGVIEFNWKAFLGVWLMGSQHGWGNGLVPWGTKPLHQPMLIKINDDRQCHWVTIIHDDVIKWKHFRVTGPLCGESVKSLHKGQRRGALMFSLICALNMLNKRLSKQSWGWWFETSMHSLWRHCNARWSTEVLTS